MFKELSAMKFPYLILKLFIYGIFSQIQLLLKLDFLPAFDQQDEPQMLNLKLGEETENRK